MSEMLNIARRLDAAILPFNESDIVAILDKIFKAADDIGKSWCNSNIGYHACVYYEGFQAPPPGAHFSSEWGFDSAIGMGTRGSWSEYTFQGVKDLIYSEAGSPSLENVTASAEALKKLVLNEKAALISALSLANPNNQDSYISSLQEKIEKIKIPSAGQLSQAILPRQATSRDSLALHQGIKIAPHQDILCTLNAIKMPAVAAETLSDLAKQAGSHQIRKEKMTVKNERIGTNVFIGHGRSLAWRDLKDFIRDRVRLPYDEFNRVPVAGITNIARLAEMLDAASIAFVMLTAEDELADGKTQARMNVIHEVGLFQGRLGFTRAIVLLEEGCEEFSNIQGLGQIRFPAGNISAKFEEIRRVLEREGLV